MSNKTLAHFMQLQAVAAYMEKQGMDITTLKTTKQFINVERTGPLDLLSDKDIFIGVSSIGVEVMTAHQLRCMECEVTTCLDDPRWYAPIDYL